MLSVNTAAVDAPETVNADPHGEGWLYTVRVAAAPEGLLDADGYAALAEAQA